MKRILSIFLAAVMLLGVMPWQVFAEEQDGYPITIKMYNAADKKIEKRTFSSPDEALGQWFKNAGRSDWSYRTFRRIFYGWSTDEKFKEPVNANIIKPDDKIYRDIESISAVKGFDKEKDVLYPVISPWYHQKNPKIVSEFREFKKLIAGASGVFSINVKLNNDKVENLQKAEEIIPEAVVKKDENVPKSDSETGKRLITSYYDPEKDWYGVQAVSEFTFNDLRIPFLLTENPLGIIKSAKGVTDFSGKNPEGYSYEDLVVKLDDKMEVAEKQKNWTFESSTFIVSAVLDENYNVLDSEITLPESDKLVTTFSFNNPTKANKFIIRTTPRNDNSDAQYGSTQSYPTDNILKVTGAELLKPMLLKTGEYTNIKITNDYSKKLAEDKQMESANNGETNGLIAIKQPKLDWRKALALSLLGIKLENSYPIKKGEANNTMNFDFVIPIVRFDKNTEAFGDTEEQNLGYSKFAVNKAMDSDGFDQDTQPNKDITQAGEAFISDKDYKVGETKLAFDGKEYTFKGWNTKADGSGDFVKADTAIKYEDLNQKDNDRVDEDMILYAIWEAKEEPQPNPNPQPNPQGPFYKGSTLILPEEKEVVPETEEHMAYIFGYPDKSVKPEGTLTRAEAAAMVTRLGNLDLSDTTKADYPDLKDGAWYLPYMNAALRAGMLDTDEAGNLRPDAAVTRGEFVKMIAAIDKASDGKAPFTDIAGHKYEKEINQVYGNGRAIGYEDGSFKPDASLTRAEAATFLNRVFNRIADDAAVLGLEDRLEKFTDLQKGAWYYDELVEATNSHELIRRGGEDGFHRGYEKWTALLDKQAAR